ncbi:hypothetical protein C1645_832888 [Glomus cerebriforme]|uniref:Uncharacterized protein n=1 Tax=Glomus cerebriforme TaxID=658196 RepID=A0A397SIN0_9GLOM|nr:hypothetical protein C1645_832888 [Glomus cerebriforme]
MFILCSDCYRISFEFNTGCRYCLTTNVIFGLTNQSQCKKCNRITSIILDIADFSSGNSYFK